MDLIVAIRSMNREIVEKSEEKKVYSFFFSMNKLDEKWQHVYVEKIGLITTVDLVL